MSTCTPNTLSDFLALIRGFPVMCEYSVCSVHSLNNQLYTCLHLFISFAIVCLLVHVIDVCLSHILCLAVHVHYSISMHVYVHYLGERERKVYIQ